METYKLYKNGKECNADQIKQMLQAYFGIVENNPNHCTVYESVKYGDCFNCVMNEPYMERNLPIDYEVIQVSNN